MERRKLSDTRKAVVHKFRVGKAKGYIRVGLFEDGSPGEIFINMDRSVDAGWIGCVGILTSMALQRGVPLRDIVRKLSYTRFPPQGITGNPEIRTATSVMDYIVRWLWNEYGDDSNAMTEEKVASLDNGA